MKRYFYLLLMSGIFSLICIFAPPASLQARAEDDCVWGEWITDTEPTCTQAGYRHRICLLDPTYPHEEREIIPPLGHDYTVTEIPPSCVESGIRTYKCKRCDYTYSEEYAAPGEHHYKSVVTKRSTCEESGEITYTCTICGHSYKEFTVKTGHKYKELTVKAPDCTGVGLKKYVCSECDDSYTEEFGTIQPHSFERKTEIKDNVKIVTEVCRSCGYTREIERTVIKEYEPKEDREEKVSEEKSNTAVVACAVAGAADVVVFGGFTASILSDVSVLRWYKRKKKQVLRLREAMGGKHGKL